MSADVRWRAARAAALVLVSLASCTGQVDDGAGGGPSGPDTPGASGVPGTPGAGSGTAGAPPAGVAVPAGTKFRYACAAPQLQGAGNAAMRRLTRKQLVNTLKDLLGADVVGDATIQTSLNRLDADVVGSAITDVAPDPSREQPEVLLAVSARAADLLAAPQKIGSFFGACAEGATVADQCATTFIGNFGLKALRRPVTAAESASLLATFKKNGGGAKGLRTVLMRLLQSPQLVFMLEQGQSRSGARTRLTDHEVAARISYMAADTMPDAPLFGAAARGELQDLKNVEAHVQRLLDGSASAKAKLADVVGFYAGLDDSPDLHTGALALDGLTASTLPDEIGKEANEFIGYHVGRKDSRFRDLLTSTAAFPRSARMAKILEVAAPITGAEPGQASANHAGLLLRPGVLGSSATRTPAMHRGKILRAQVLCDTLPAPPLEAVAAAVAAGPDRSKLSNRAYLTMMTAPPACASCHALVNPLGFALEGYDQVGMTRTMETSYDDKGKPAATFPVDAAVKVTALDPDVDLDVTSGPALGSALAGLTKARACFARTAFEYYRLRPSVDADSCALRTLESAATDGGNLRAFFLANVANEDIFWKGN